MQVGGREDSNVYIRAKIKSASEIGIRTEHVKMPRSTTEAEVLSNMQEKWHASGTWPKKCSVKEFNTNFEILLFD